MTDLRFIQHRDQKRNNSQGKNMYIIHVQSTNMVATSVLTLQNNYLGHVYGHLNLSPREDSVKFLILGLFTVKGS